MDGKVEGVMGGGGVCVELGRFCVKMIFEQRYEWNERGSLLRREEIVFQEKKKKNCKVLEMVS